MSEQVVSEYRKGKRYLRLTRNERWGYGYEGNRCGGGFGTETPFEEAMRQFARLVRMEPVELEHVAGEKVPEIVAEGAPMTTADFKRLFATGSKWMRNGAVPVTVLQARSKDIVLALYDNPEAKSYLDYPKASRLRRLPDGTIHVLNGEGKPQLTYTPA